MCDVHRKVLDFTDVATGAAAKGTENGLSAIGNFLGRSVECIGSSANHVAVGVKKAANHVADGAKFAFGKTQTFCIHSGSAMKKGALHVGTYIKNNWQKLTLYLVAWALIILASGALWGFKRTALPLTIGISAGLGFGLLTAILTAKVFDPKNKAAGKNTVWSLFFHKYNSLEFVTRQIMLSVVTTVFLALCMKFPHTGGAVAGLIMGNHLFTYMLLNSSLKKVNEQSEQDPATIEELKNQRDTLQKELHEAYKTSEEHLKKFSEEFHKRLQLLEEEYCQRNVTVEHAH